ncbi:hypothetical protein SAMN04489859_101921 [Paracoccus alcaliphilus]|uniref:Lipoprotein n=1 Tax=Paracoccus alcaliphilus TaxID=34002 RepID=A0A1H8JWZ9_9RHOB|nr:hypothetical protein [Paracoccus alcaliphilus]WCR20540.1 hypothetical protein JHW40_21830 [Paracoccus alcaliphilus]SEN84917.1 hypothetical protein SAMN04489859_101921 [Paracoccus alcaliphilus]
MIRFIVLASVLALSACSSSTTTTTRATGGISIGDLRATCQQGNRSACNAVSAHDGLL